MKKNLGNIDRAIRLILAAILVYLYFSNIIDGTMGLIGVIVAIVFAATSLISFCPIYFSMGLSSKGNK